MKTCQLNKKVLRISNHAWEFLNGITSNTKEAPNNAFLNIHGRIIAAFNQIQIDEDDFLIVVEKDYTSALLKHLERFAALSGTKIEQTKLSAYFDLDNSVPVEGGDQIIPQKKGKLIITPRNLKTTASEEEFRLFRLANNIPLHGIDFKDDFLLNVSMSDFVSFTKGCYLGQEPVSKVYNRSKPSWRLTVKKEKECTEEEKAKMTSVAADPKTGERLGFVFVRSAD